MKTTLLKLPKWMHELGWRTLAGALLLGGIVHIAATLAVPLIAPGNAFQKLRDTLPVNRMVVLPPSTPESQLLPYMAPDALHAICRFDISANMVQITATLADTGWALSLHTPQGDNFYVMPAQQLRRSEVTLVVVPGGDRLSDVGAGQRRVAGVETHIASPTEQGLIIVRAPLKGLAWRAETEAALRRANCTPLKQASR